MPPIKKTFRFEATIKSAILNKIAAERAMAGGGAGLDSYYKNPNYDKGGVYGKGSDPVFGKSDPPKIIDIPIDITSRAKALESVAKAASRIRKARGIRG